MCRFQCPTFLRSDAYKISERRSDIINGNYFLPNNIFDEYIKPRDFAVYSFPVSRKDRNNGIDNSVPLSQILVTNNIYKLINPISKFEAVYHNSVHIHDSNRIRRIVIHYPFSNIKIFCDILRIIGTPAISFNAGNITIMPLIISSSFTL